MYVLKRICRWWWGRTDYSEYEARLRGRAIRRAMRRPDYRTCGYSPHNRTLVRFNTA
jgi:hypothetical protein